jgi:polysaccharide deacetylase family protein (PEP-CTERM system associated)
MSVIQTGIQIDELTCHPEINMLSVDVECWRQIICETLTGRSIPPSAEAAESTRELLAIFRQRDIKATFFVLGQVAETFPDLARQIEAEGHEIGLHGLTHTPLKELSPETFRTELTRAQDILGKLITQPIRGFRAPKFSIAQETFWALDILSELGFVYDSSIVPIKSPRYGIPSFPKGLARIDLGDRSIVEVTPCTTKLLGKDIPVSGGRFFRFAPYPFLSRVVMDVNRRGRPFLVYIHPYEIGLEPLRCTGFSHDAGRLRSLVTEWKWNVARKNIRSNLIRLLDRFRFAPIGQVVEQTLQCNAP